MAQFQSFSDLNMLKIPVDQIPAQVMQGLKDAIHNFSNSTPNYPPGASQEPTTVSSPANISYQTIYSQGRRSPPSQPTSVALTGDTRHATSNWSVYPAAGLPGHLTRYNSHFDEVDGAAEDSVVHAVQMKKPSVKVIDALDDSDIVRIFDAKEETKQTLSRSDSEIVRIFESGPTGEKRLADDSESLRTRQTGNSPEKRQNNDPNVVHLHAQFSVSDQEIGNNHEHCRNTLAGPKTIGSPMMEAIKTASSTCRISSPRHDNQIKRRQNYDTSCLYLDTQPSSTNSYLAPTFYADINSPLIGSNNKSSSQTFYRRSLCGPQENSPSTSTSQSEEKRRPRLSHTIPIGSLGPADPLTPPQTPHDVDPEDDEVFSNEDVVTRRCDSYRHPLEITPRRDASLLRQSSDRSMELHCPSPFSPCQKLAEISFGDRQNTKKRLSFDDDKQPQQSHRSTMVQPSFSVPNGQSSYNGANGPFQVNSCRQPESNNHWSAQSSRCSQPLSYHKRVSSCPSASSTPITSDSQQSFQLESQPHPVSQGQTSSCRSPVNEVMKMLELASSHHSPKSSSIIQRSRIHSDGDSILDGNGQGQWRPRGQTFSYGKRRRLNSSVGCEVEEDVQCDQVILTPSREPAEDLFEDCHCAIIEKCVLQMAENAYKRIKKLDATPEDFERFRKELATTNDLLRQSLVIINSIRTICHHRSRSSSSSSSSSMPTTRPS